MFTLLAALKLVYCYALHERNIFADIQEKEEREGNNFHPQQTKRKFSKDVYASTNLKITNYYYINY